MMFETGNFLSRSLPNKKLPFPSILKEERPLGPIEDYKESPVILTNFG